MSYLGKLLANDERVVRVSREHWIALFPTIMIDAVVSLAVIGLSVVAIVLTATPLPALGLLLLGVPLVHLLFHIWVWRSKQYVVTDRRIIQIAGLANKRVSDTLLEKINDILTEQSALGRLLGFGDVEIIAGSDSGVDVFRRLADPVGFKKDLLSRRVSPALEIERGDVQSVPDLIAELDELRDQGVIDDAEFEEKKRELLDRM